MIRKISATVITVTWTASVHHKIATKIMVIAFQYPIKCKIALVAITSIVQLTRKPTNVGNSVNYSSAREAGSAQVRIV